MRTLIVIVLLLAVFGASTLCVADCLTQPGMPSPCHQHSKGKTSGSEPCKLIQPVADAQWLAPPATETPTFAEIALQLLTTESAPAESGRSAAGVLRL